eukprot:2451780-Lingulodinium_polyedra.AAC.1
MQYYSDLYEVSGQGQQRFIADDHVAYNEPVEFADLVEGLAGPLLAKAGQTKALQPIGPSSWS